jgi:C4-dicarboxylate-specific signal transduction histidine kinase
VTTPRKRILIAALAAVVLLLIFAVFYRSNYVSPRFNVAPLAKGARQLTTAEVEEILTADFNLIRRVQQIPTSVKADYTVLANVPFEMVNPGQRRSTDGIIHGVPNKELVLVGLADRDH